MFPRLTEILPTADLDLGQAGKYFFHMNASSRLSEISFTYEAGGKMHYVIILYSVIIIL